jgi:FtsP/CotA-like multicopper oxidase with cupredoxin domain
MPNAIDNAPPVKPGASFDYRFAVPDAGIFWYRTIPRTQQDSRLYGALIVAEQAPPPADQDIVLMFGPPAGGDLSPVLTVDGSPARDIPVRANERLRLRFINASATLPLDARLENHRVVVMALDGEPAEPFASRDGRLVLGPGNRADVFVDAALAPGSLAPLIFSRDGGKPLTVRLVYGDKPARAAPAGEPAPLPAAALPERMNFSRAVRTTLPIDAGDGTPSRPPDAHPQALFSAERGRTVVMALDNRDSGMHIIHVHGHHFRLLDRLDDGWKPFWLDTIAVPGRQVTRVAFVADNPGRWLIENWPVDRPAATGIWFDVK